MSWAANDHLILRKLQFCRIGKTPKRREKKETNKHTIDIISKLSKIEITTQNELTPNNCGISAIFSFGVHLPREEGRRH